MSLTAVPTGVRVLTILSILCGAALLLAGGVALVDVASFASGHGIPNIVGAVIGAALLLLGFCYLVAGGGFWRGKGWSWTLALPSFVGGLVLTLGIIALAPSSSLVETVVGLGHLVVPILTSVLIYLLMSPEVKAFLRGRRLPGIAEPVGP